MFEKQIDIINTFIDNAWYELWQMGENLVYALFYDAEMGKCEWVARSDSESYIRHEVRNDMIKRGIV